MASAKLVRWLFEKHLERQDWGLRGTVAGILNRRETDPLRVFREEYGPLADPREDPHGKGPLVAAGVLNERQWVTLGDDLRKPPDSIIAELRTFCEELRR